MSSMPASSGNASELAYPYAQQEAAQYAPVVQHQVPMLEPQEQLFYAPVAQVHNQSRTTLAAVITFIAVVVGLWAILGFVGSMSATLNSIRKGTLNVKEQLTTANQGLAKLDEKTGHLPALAADSKILNKQLSGIDNGMLSMLTGVESIAASMSSMNSSLDNLGSGLDDLNAADPNVLTQLSAINQGLASQQKSIKGMSADVKATGATLGGVPPRLNATNKRMAHVNGVVNFMGCHGILQKLSATFYVGPLRNGAAQINATVVPPGSWGTNQDGSLCQ